MLKTIVARRQTLRMQLPGLTSHCGDTASFPALSLVLCEQLSACNLAMLRHCPWISFVFNEGL